MHRQTNCLFTRYTSIDYNATLCFVPSETGLRVPADTAPNTDPVSATRILCGALIQPTIATIVGKLMFGSVASNFQRTLLVRSFFFTFHMSNCWAETFSFSCLNLDLKMYV